MDWTARIDAYCERTGPEFWAEPVNALTNLGYLAVALWAFGRLAGVPLGRALALLLLAISVGSFLFHTLATRWAALADSLPIALFILLYLYGVNRHVIGWPAWAAALATAAFLPFAAGVTLLAGARPFLAISGAYWSVPVAMLLYAAALRARPGWALGLGLAAALLGLSLTGRSVDLSWCAVWPLGTHFVWHSLNAAMFVVVLETYRRHWLAASPPGR
jgi:hypothetical protein